MPVEGSASIAVRGYRTGDEGAILDLFARSFHAPRSREEWRWKFQQNPAGNERISLAFDEGRLVGHYTGYPVPFWLDGQAIEAHQIGDTMTDPSIRHLGRGPTSVLGRTALHFYEHFCEGRVAFNYGFNVANIQKFSLRFLRSDRVESVTYRVRDLIEQPLPALPRWERIARGIEFRLVTAVSNEWDALFERVAHHYRFLVLRDARYARWRYLQMPGAPYVVVEIRKWRKLVGWLVARVRGERLAIGDLLIHPEHADAIELVLRHLARVYSSRVVEGWFPPRPAWLDVVMKDIFQTRPEPQDLSVMCVPFTLADAVARMRADLYYTMGDSDLF